MLPSVVSVVVACLVTVEVDCLAAMASSTRVFVPDGAVVFASSTPSACFGPVDFGADPAVVALVGARLADMVVS